MMRRIDVRVAVSEAARAFPQSRFPGDVRIIPNGVTVEKYAAGRGRAQGARAASSSSDAPSAARGSACCSRRSRSCASARRTRRSSIAGATRRQVLETERNGSRTPVDTDGSGGSGLGRRRREGRAARARRRWSARRRSPPRASASCWPRRWPPACRWSPRTCPGYRAVLRDGQAGRLSPPGDPVALADALYDLLQDGEERRRLAAAGSAAAAELSWSAHHRQHHRGLRGRARGAEGARRARPAGQAVRSAAPLLDYAVWVGQQRLLGAARRDADDGRRRPPPDGRRHRLGPFCRAVRPYARLRIRCTRRSLRDRPSASLSRGRSSAGLERRPVTPEAAGSSPVAPATSLFLALLVLASAGGPAPASSHLRSVLVRSRGDVRRADEYPPVQSGSSSVGSRSSLTPSSVARHGPSGSTSGSVMRTVDPSLGSARSP